MEKIKIGVYVFTHQIKARKTKRRECFFDGQNYIGLRYILKEVQNKIPVTISYVSKETIDTVDYVLISLTSYYDEINVINELYGIKHKSKIIIGGAGFNNVGLLRDIADIGVVGRGENIVCDIIAGKRVDGVYFKDSNYELNHPIFIQPLRNYIEIEDATIGIYRESALGCPRKCFFCEYSFKHRYTAKHSGYSSGLINRETLFRDINFDNYLNKDLVSAIDGSTEETRYIINKPLTDTEITDKINEIYKCKRNYISLKLYCLVGYPFESRFAPDDTVRAIISARSSKNSAKRLNVVVVSPHFIPMPFTPMECEPVNFTNFRKAIEQYDFEKYGKGNINVFWPSRLASSPIAAAEATILNRCEEAEKVKKILCSSKYKNMQALGKRAVLEKYFGDILGRVDKVLPYILRNNPTDKMKDIYYDRIKHLTTGKGAASMTERPADGKTPAPKKINVKRAKKAEKKENA